ncbi:suppressor of fused domain protein [Mesorhizobium sp. NPDC059025]|uniref:suppressor of fused domain protein n=1 Tax=unclassified Mesorhizobium TaxID=325217 RepID=UPI00369A01D9
MITASKIRSHYEDNWRSAADLLTHDRGPVRDFPKEFGILRFEPRDNRRMWTYATCGMSLFPNTKGLELHIFSEKREDSLIELLYVVAHFQLSERELGLWHSVNFGRPWLGDSKCSYGLISLPYLDGPSLENLNDGASLAKFYWLLPVTRDEIEFKKREGVDSLERVFEEKKVNYLDENRNSVV